MPAQNIDEKEIDLVKDAVLFPYILSTLEHDLKVMSDSNLKMKELYVQHLRKLQDDVTKKNYELRKEMRNRGIKILKEDRFEKHFETQYLVRGYTHKFHMLYTLLKVQIQEKLSIFMSLYAAEENKTVH